jgi:hypothetical protein
VIKIKIAEMKDNLAFPGIDNNDQNLR